MVTTTAWIGTSDWIEPGGGTSSDGSATGVGTDRRPIGPLADNEASRGCQTTVEGARGALGRTSITCRAERASVSGAGGDSGSTGGTMYMK